MAKIRLLVSAGISLCPLNWMRRLLYQLLLGYKIDRKAHIGFMTIIAVQNADIEVVNIGMFNKFVGPYDLTIKKGTSIGKDNEFSCGQWVTEQRFQQSGYGRFCKIGEDCVVTRSHYIDTTGGFILGDRSWIAGYSSQFWTHGIGTRDRAISIGEDCYIGSAARFAPGASVYNNSLVGLGSIVVGNFSKENVLITGAPARVIKTEYYWRTRYNSPLNDSDYPKGG